MTTATKSTDADRVADALALLWSHRPRTTIHAFLRQIEIRTGSGKYLSAEDVKELLQVLSKAGRVQEHPQRQGFWRLAEPERSQGRAAHVL